ncbi:MAG: polymer-forming cytoskeletal protein [Gammaproteobacteria bacterium]
MRKLRDKVSTPGTILGKDFVIEGDVKGTGSIIISGTVKGNGEIDGLVELVSTAVWEGDIHTDDITIGGTVKGDVFARGKLEITGSARIFGNVSGTSVSVAQGAMIDGTMKIHDGNSLVEKSDQKTSLKSASNKTEEQLNDTFKEATSF